MEQSTTSPVKRMSLELRVIRKDGAVEDLGIVAYYHVRRICRVLYWIERLTGSRWARSLRESYERH